MMKIHRKCLPPAGWTVADKIRDIATINQAILAGGTALALRIGHRESIDLDFFTRVQFDTDSLLRDLSGKGLSVEPLSMNQKHLVALIDGMKFSIFNYPYRFLDEGGCHERMRIAGIRDIAAMKIIAIQQRGSRKDFVDLYFILQKKLLTISDISRSVVNKFSPNIERINPILIGKSLTFFDDADRQPDVKFLPGQAVAWPLIKKFFRSQARTFTVTLANALREAPSPGDPREDREEGYSPCP